MMVRIIRAAMGYPTIPAGFPILVSERMSIIKPAFAWLMELATIPGRSHAVETVRTYSEHLHDWFDSLEQSGLDWRGVSEAEIAAWRNRMLSQPSPHTKRPYARSTVNDRVRTICRFYAWAQGRGWIESLPFHFVDMRVGAGRRQSFLAHVDGRPGVMAANILTVSEHEHLPRPLRVDQLRRVFAHLEMPYGLMAEWALATGLRRKELCGLAVFQVPETAHLDAEDHPLIGVPLTITKGDKPRTIYPPIRLVDRTQRYVDEVRTPQVRALRRRRASYRPPSALFLSHDCLNPVAGIALGSTAGRVCQHFGGCLRCPGLVIPIDADHMARILQAKTELERARDRIDPRRFELLYASSLHILTHAILPDFPQSLRMEAEQRISTLPILPALE